MLILALVTGGAAAAAADARRAGARPMVFVHGSSGSALQFETQAMRFASNGFPQNRIYAYEYDTSVELTENAEQVYAGLDDFIDEVRAETGARKVDVLAHSRGTSVMHGYLAVGRRARRVANYVNYDGRTATTEPGGVRTLAVWAEGDQTRQIGGAENVYLPDQSHTESVTSEQSFERVYRFLRGRAPRTTAVVREPRDEVTIAGRAALQPQNSGVAGARVQLWPLDPDTGHRATERPARTFRIGPSGAFGPVRVEGGTPYEMTLLRPGVYDHHFYYQPFRRDDHFVRLLTQQPGAGNWEAVTKGPGHTALTVSRNREWRGDQPDARENDTLLLDGRALTNAANTVRSRRVITQYLFDAGADGVTQLETPLSPFVDTAFQTGIDVFAPASPDASGTHSVAAVTRGSGGRTAVVNIPDWASSGHRVSVQLRDDVPR